MDTKKKSPWINTKEYIILHHTWWWTFKGNVEYLANNEAEVSAHVIIWKNKWEIAFIWTFDDILWHCWVSSYDWKTWLNKYSIGIEVVWPWFTDFQRKAVRWLVDYLMNKYDIPSKNVIRHKDITDRKVDIDDSFWNNEFSTFKEYQDSFDVDNTEIEGYDERDYKFTSLPKVDKHKPYLELNQASDKFTRSSCVLYSTAWALSDLTWYKFTQEDMVEITELAHSMWLKKEGWWMFLWNWPKVLKKWWKDRFHEDLIYYRLDIKKDLDYVLDKWYTVISSYKTTEWYLLDILDNWQIDTIDGFKYRWWWHAIRIVEKWKIVDSYKPRPYNIYTNEHILDFVEKWKWRDYWFIILPKKLIMQDFIDVDKNHPFYKEIMELKSEWITNWYEDWTFRPDEPVSRWEMAVFINRLLSKL